MQLKKYFLFFFMLSGFVTFSQIKVGQWLDHLPYNNANSVAKVGDLVYVSNGSGLAKYNVDDNSIEKFTKIDGLSDVGVKLLRKCSYNNKLLVIYDNTNIDVIDREGRVINISDIKRKIIPGKKYINEVFFHDNMAYIACGFGIVVFDTDKMEIKDTYYLGNGVTNIEVLEVTKNDTAFFAATPSGIYYGNKNSNLSNFQSWKSLNIGLPTGIYNTIVNFNGKIITNYSKILTSDIPMSDTLYQYDGTSWTKNTFKVPPYEIRKLYSYPKYGKLLILDQWGLSDHITSGVSTTYIADYGSGIGAAEIKDAYFENDGHYWLADKRLGLINSQGGAFSINEVISQNGPNTKLINDLDCKDGNLYTAATYLGDAWNNAGNPAYINTFKDREWNSGYSTILDTIIDINCVAIDPNDKNHVVYGSWAKGVIEMKNDQIFKVYNTSNSSLTAAFGSAYDARVGGVFFDNNSNIWAVSSLNNQFLNVIKKNGTSINFNFTSVAGVNTAAPMPLNPNAGKVLVDKNNYVWVQLARGNGMMVYNPGTTFPQPNASNAKVVSSAVGSGALPSLDVRSMVEDKDGKIWVGTAEGIAVFYNPENVFTGGKWDCQQILIEQDGHVQILLENDVITAIAVDGVNRKWIGTESSGVYCLSADGQTEIYHFTTENSPLYSNIIRDIITDESSGDVFIASESGIQSYRTSIIKGFDEYTNVHCYPNPVRPGSTANVYVTGLVDESVVKITDVAGNLVWQTKSQGGQIEWNLQTFSGTRASSGVYMIYCATATGELSATTKLLVIN